MRKVSRSARRSHFQQVPFAIDDGTGRVEIRVPDSDEEIERRAEAFDEYAFDGKTSIGETAATRRYTQGILEEGDDASVMGRAYRGDDGDLAVTDDPAAFALSNTGDGGPTARGQILGGIGRGLLGFALTVIGASALALPWVPV